MTRPLISDAVGATLSPLWLGEFPKNVRPDFRSEGAESEEVSGLPLEEVEVLEQPLEGVLGEVLGWKECAGAWNRKYSKASLELGGSQSPKSAEDV